MSLATASAGGLGGVGGAGGVAGGIAIAHQANAVARPAPQAPPSGPQMQGTAPPVSIAALGADLVDKNQSLTLKQVKAVSHLPLVAVDMYASEPMVAMFPPKPKDPDPTLMPSLVGKIKPKIIFRKTETAHKTLRKFLTKEKTYESLLANSIAPSTTEEQSAVVTLDKPHQWLGFRRLEHVLPFLKENNPVVVDQGGDESATAAMIAEESVSNGVEITNGTLDGVSAPSGDDFDRVVYKVRLAANKKALTVLPEEATSLVLAVAQNHVAKKATTEDDPLDYPVAVALPGWACHDPSMEAWLDVTSCGAFFQRSTAALAGCLLPAQKGSSNPIIDRMQTVMKAKYTQHEKENDGSTFDYAPLLVLIGISSDGIECTAAEASIPQSSTPACLFGSFKVLADVAMPHPDPASQLEKCLRDLYDKLDEVAPEIYGPVGIVCYGSKGQQAALVPAVEKIRGTLETWEKVPVFTTKPECVSMGTAVLGAVSHGRIATLTEGANKKPKAQIAVKVHNVVTAAVGVRMSYREGEWTAVKTIFDFDRRVPAGPYPLEVNAAECAAIRASKNELSEEELVQATKEYEGSKAIPKREEAALAVRLQVLQRWTRDSDWVPIGDEFAPLTHVVVEKDGEKRIACEKLTLTLSVGHTGMIVSSMEGELQSVVQATKSARNSALRYYLGIVLAIAFFGGFLIKSYWEEHAFEHDTKRLLAYYKHVVPGSLADGDENNARYLVWKYRGKRDKLWRRLEVKYGVPVRLANEWEEEEEDQEEDEEENLDESEDDSGDDDKEEEPDL